MDNSFDALNKAVDSLLAKLANVDRVAASIGGAGGAGGSSGGVMNGSLAPISKVATGAQMVGAGMAGMAGFAAGAAQMLPSVDKYMARESAFYGAGVSSGGVMGRGALQNLAKSSMRGGENIANAPAVVSAILTSRSIMPNSAQFSQTVTSVGQAAKYLNMSNDVAAQAFSGFNSGATSSNLMRRMGIMTSDPRTGESLSQNQIFSQMYNRFTGGKTASLKGTMDSLQKGYLGAAIKNSGMDSAQQEILKSQFIGRAMGVNLDYSKPGSRQELQNKLSAQGFDNVLDPVMQVNTAEDKVTEAATERYKVGTQNAADALSDLADVVGDKSNGLIQGFMELKSFLDTFMGSGLGAGPVAAGASLIGAGASIATTGMAYKASQAMMAGGSKTVGAVKPGGPKAGAQPSPKTNSKFNLGKSLSKGAGKSFGPAMIASVAGSLVGDAIASGAEVGSDQSKWGNALGTAASWAGMGAMLGSVIPGLGTGIGAGIGAAAGGLVGYFSGGTPSTIGMGNSTQTSGTVKLGFPVSGPITCKFGVKDKMHPNGHRGTDFGVAEGTPVGAAGDGVVADVSYSSALGKIIIIDHGQGISTLYAHLSQQLVSKGDRVTAGTRIGMSGNTGTATTGPHLHFEVRKGGQPTNPGPYLGAAVTVGAGDFTNEFGSQSSSSSSGTSATYGGVSSISGALEGIANTAENREAKLPAAYSGASYTSKGAQVSGSGVGQARTASNTGAGSTSSTGGGEDYVPVNTYGGLVSAEAKEPKESSVVKSVHNEVTIELKIAKASESEAKKFAKQIKQYLEDENLTSNMGSR